MDEDGFLTDLTEKEKSLILLFRGNNEEAKKLILPLLSGQLPPVSLDLKSDSA